MDENNDSLCINCKAKDLSELSKYNANIHMKSCKREQEMRLTSKSELTPENKSMLDFFHKTPSPSELFRPVLCEICNGIYWIQLNNFLWINHEKKIQRSQLEFDMGFYARRVRGESTSLK